jgi:hypothetical protein
VLTSVGWIILHVLGFRRDRQQRYRGPYLPKPRLQAPSAVRCFQAYQCDLFFIRACRIQRRHSAKLPEATM